MDHESLLKLIRHFSLTSVFFYFLHEKFHLGMDSINHINHYLIILIPTRDKKYSNMFSILSII